MLDIDILVEATDDPTDVVSRAMLKRHMRITSTALDTLLDEAIADAVGKIDGIGGELNRTIRPRTYRRWMKNFPSNDADGNVRPIQLPYGPLLELVSLTIEDGSSPENALTETTDFVVKSGATMIVPEIHPVSGWPTIDDAVRGVSVVYRAGYTEYPAPVQRLVKILAAHYVENVEATINEPRQMMINRRVEFGVDDLRNALKIPLSQDDWNE